ncbi:MAG: histidine kinase [Aquimonas sp.]|nr:histidine kinase [Aquimonas sp.]
MAAILRGMQPHPNAAPSAVRPREGMGSLPLTVAAVVTWAAVTLTSLRFDRLAEGEARHWVGVLALLGMLGLFLLRSAREPEPGSRAAVLNVLMQGALVLAAEFLLRSGMVTVLLIIVAAQLVLLMPMRWVVLALLVLNAGVWWRWSQHMAPLEALLGLVPLLGFQAFAGLTGHYAGSSERAREHLAQVNAELLATQRLLEESARSGERLKLSRELHDVAGHKLTALKLQLSRLARDPTFGAQPAVGESLQLVDELLGDIRGVVGALRAHDGLELEQALHALARPLPGTRIEVRIEPGLRVESVAAAEALLRCAQEAITNALRHGRAARIEVSLRREGAGLLLQVDNDGETPRRIDEGHGLGGMRERLAALGGQLQIEMRAPRGLRLQARLPGAQA